MNKFVKAFSDKPFVSLNGFIAHIKVDGKNGEVVFSIERVEIVSSKKKYSDDAFAVIAKFFHLLSDALVTSYTTVTVEREGKEILYATGYKDYFTVEWKGARFSTILPDYFTRKIKEIFNQLMEQITDEYYKGK